MTGEPWRPWRPGDDPLALRYMTSEQVAGLVARARANTEPFRVATARKVRERWERWRAQRGRP